MIVYLQDIEYPPILPKVPIERNSEMLELPNFDFKALKSQLIKENKKTLEEIFWGFLDFYFNGKFNHVTDVINMVDCCI